jgi:succinate dehydrogenase / fumarate reductase cytochrome b subunit
MKDVFSQPWAVILYLLGCFSLAWHLLHGIQSAAQTLGWTNKNFMPMITNIGIVFSILVPAIFALMPVFMYFGWEINTGALTLLF